MLQPHNDIQQVAVKLQQAGAVRYDKRYIDDKQRGQNAQVIGQAQQMASSIQEIERLKQLIQGRR